MSAPSVSGRLRYGRGKGIVDEERNAGGVGDRGDLRNVEHFQAGIADGLGDHQPGVGADRGAETVEVARLDERGRDAEARQRVGEKIDAAAIERRRRDDMVAGASKRGDGKMHRRHAARRTDGADAVFQRREPLLQHRRGRVGNARVDVAGAFQVEQPGGVIGIVEHVGRGLVDRDGARAGDRIGMLPGMQAQGLERRGFWSGHAFLAVRKLRQRCNVVERLGTSRLFRPRFAQTAERRKDGRAMDQAISNDTVILERAMGNRPFRRCALKSLAFFRRPVGVL